MALVTLAMVGAPGRADLAPGRAPEVAPRLGGPQEAEVVAVVVDPRTQTPTVLLRGKRDGRQLAMAIGPAEATGIAVPLQGVTPPRPLTHDLFLTLFGRLNVSLTRVVITDLRDDVYYATLHLERRRRRPHARLAPLRRHRAGHPGQGRPCSSRTASSTRAAPTRRAAPAPAHLMSRLPADDLQWALQRRLEDVFAKLGEKFGDLTGRVETEIHPAVSFEEVGGLQQAKTLLRGFALALSQSGVVRDSGASRRPRGILLYGPPGTGKSKLARALATAAGAIFFHVKLMNLTSKFGANTGELLQEILRIAGGEGRAVLFLDEAEALSLEHLLPPPAAREASARLVAALCEKLDGLPPTGRVLVVGATSRTDAVDAELVAPGPPRPPGRGRRCPTPTPSARSSSCQGAHRAPRRAGRCSRRSTTASCCP